MSNKDISYKLLAKFYTWCEGMNLLTDDGIENLDTIGCNSKIYREDFNKLGQQLVNNYFEKWLETVDYNNLTQESTDLFWNNRYNEISLVNARKLISETSFDFNNKIDNTVLDLPSYLTSIDYNTPKGTKHLVLNTEYHNHYLKVNNAVAYDQNMLKIPSQDLDILSYNPKLSQVLVRESSDLKEVIKSMIRGLKNLKESWNYQDNEKAERYCNKTGILVEARIPELSLAIRLN